MILAIFARVFTTKYPFLILLIACRFVWEYSLCGFFLYFLPTLVLCFIVLPDFAWISARAWQYGNDWYEECTLTMWVVRLIALCSIVLNLAQRWRLDTQSIPNILRNWPRNWSTEALSFTALFTIQTRLQSCARSNNITEQHKVVTIFPRFEILVEHRQIVSNHTVVSRKLLMQFSVRIRLFVKAIVFF